jgi:hypothetical protein
MDVDISYGISFADGVMVITCLGVTSFAGGPNALEWALAFRDGKSVDSKFEFLERARGKAIGQERYMRLCKHPCWYVVKLGQT